MLVKRDALALHDILVSVTSAEEEDLAWADRLQGPKGSELLLFGAGRFRTIKLDKDLPGVRLRRDALVAADPDVEVKPIESEKDFLMVSGDGQVIISG
jgi:hypothetical protein